MHKNYSDLQVKKTLVRNCEKKVKPGIVVREVACTSKTKTSKLPGSSMKENKLNQPSLCSSEALAQYLSDAKIAAPPPLTAEDLNANKGRICAKVTKKLNFHFNDRIYRNLIELNTNVEDHKKKKDKRPSSSNSVKRDLEPNIEDFYEEIKDNDSSPDIPVIKLKFKPVKKVENGQLHKLIAAFEDL